MIKEVIVGTTARIQSPTTNNILPIIAVFLQTEFTFTLPRGYIDDTGMIHREGTMRLANAADEILPLKDPRVQQNPGYLTIILLARVITKLGSLPAVDTRTVEKFFTMDLAYLQDLYERINTV